MGAADKAGDGRLCDGSSCASDARLSPSPLTTSTLPFRYLCPLAFLSLDPCIRLSPVELFFHPFTLAPSYVVPLKTLRRAYPDLIVLSRQISVMPTASSKPARPIERSYSNPVPRKHRTVKRRGRAKDEFESDEEIVREVRTDSETDDDHSSIDSDSDSESSSSDLPADAHSEVVTPSTTQSPPPTELDRLPGDTAKDPSNSVGIFANATNWAEMVAGEDESGAADLPVIDFADMDGHLPEPHPPSPSPRSRKSHKAGKKSSTARATSAPPPASPSHQESIEGLPEEQEPIASTSHDPLSRSAFPRSSRGQTARQAYQQRLESDPSFVPKVGEFWGHDDRLLDKDLRSLSGWWRGRWQSRGRGRGGFGMRGRGGGGFFPNTSRSFSQDEGATPEEPAVPPVERTWTHDGFEEMKRRDERRRAQQEQQQPSSIPQRGFGFRGRGFVAARGRGGAFARGASTSPTTTHRPLNSNVSMGERVWYAQKPERMWTKQHDIFLYSDVATKPRPGVGPGVRVKLPGGNSPLIIRLPPRAPGARASDKFESTRSSPPEAEKPIVVRIPATSGKAKVIEEQPAAPAEKKELATTVEELSIEEVFTVRPNAVPNRRVDLSAPSSTAPSHTSQPGPGVPSTPPPRVPQPTVVEEVRHPIEQLSTLPVDDDRSSPSVQIQESILRNPPTSEEADSNMSSTLPPEEPQPRPAISMLHPLQTSFSPVPPATSPPYGSPFGYAPPLPPGIGVNNQGMPYEYATGRPVYIQPTPPPMYTPRPMMHGHHPSLSVPFVPMHLRHHSTASPDFLAHPHTPHAHTPIQSFVDPATGVPIFSPARQGSRIEIRAPTDGGEGKKPVRASHQRSSLSVAYSAEAAQPPFFAQQGTSAEDGPPSEELPPQPPMGHTHTPSMDSNVGYAPYPQPYYYHPEQYGYPPYVDMSQQMVHYEMYPPEQQHPQPHPQHHPSQPIVYY